MTANDRAGDPGPEAQHRIPGGPRVRGRGLGLPSILYNLFWRRFDIRGAVWAIYGGLISCVGLVFLSPVVSGSSEALFTGQDWSYLPSSITGIISIPFGLLRGWLGTITSREPESEARYAELEVRALTAAGAERAVIHL